MKVAIQARLLLVFAATLTVPVTAAVAQNVTFTRDVAPILQARCETCHRAGGAGPFELITFSDARDSADRILENVL